MRQPLKTPDNNYSRGHAGLVDDAPLTSPDWEDMARAAWDAPGWQAAPAEYHNNHQSAVKIQRSNSPSCCSSYTSEREEAAKRLLRDYSSQPQEVRPRTAECGGDWAV